MVRWVLIAVLIMIALAVLYRVAPDRDSPKLRWASPGAIVATTLVWLVVSVGFSLYDSLFAGYAKTYGALAGIVVLLMWLWLTSYAVLFGAEINAEAEQQIIKDSPWGPRSRRASAELSPPTPYHPPTAAPAPSPTPVPATAGRPIPQLREDSP